MTIGIDGVLHPRPQLARRRWIDLRGPWKFAYDDDERGLEENWHGRDDVFTRTIEVPFPPESEASGIGNTSFHPVVWYRRSFEIGADDAGKKLILHCGAIDYRARVWVNSQLVATHVGGQTPFSADITGAVNPDGRQVIVIRAEDRPGDLAQPRGKQDWLVDPHNIWYHRTTGIWQPVWIEPVAETHITNLLWTPDLDEGSLAVTIAVSPHETPVQIRLQLSLHGEPLVDDIVTATGSEVRREMTLDLGSTTMARSHILWSPSSPNLIDAIVTVIKSGEVIDEVKSYAGLRSVGTAGGRFMLNGGPYYLRMALEQGYWPKTHLASPSDEALRREVELAKELGFNSVRIHQKVEDPRFLYWCDRLGLAVWGEMANSYVFSRSSVDRLTREWLDVVNRDLSHPCIVAWVPLNESWGVPNLIRDPAQQHFVQTLYHLTKTLDPTRPVISNDGWEYICGDIVGIHDYTFHGSAIRGRYGSSEAVDRTLREVQPQFRFMTLGERRPDGAPIMLTEFGGISYRASADNVQWFGYGTVESEDAFLEKYRELVDAVLDCPSIAGFCYTQLTDTLQETNGLLTEDRRFKLDPLIIRAINQRPSSAVPGEIIAALQRRTPAPFPGTTERASDRDPA
ncbi:MAG: glycoside hydrolase family 2 TIM barrel-domain containing protein [Chloroflexota bacterium]